MSSRPCPACGAGLRKGVFVSGRAWKSCPECSGARGEHVYRTYPDDFGTTEARSSDPNPDGPQSYCNACRGRGSVSGKQLQCSNVQEILRRR